MDNIAIKQLTDHEQTYIFKALPITDDHTEVNAK